MDFVPGNENPSAVGRSAGVENKSDGTPLKFAARQVSVCTCNAENATGRPREFDEKRKQKNAEKVRLRLSSFEPAEAPYCKPLPTQTRLIELFNYDPETGVLTWKVSRGGQRAGDMAGTPIDGYVQIFVDGIAYRAHRLIFKLVYGREPIGHIDHENGNRSDNRLVKNDSEKSNLREVLPWQNSLNRIAPTDSNTGHRGVSWIASAQRYLASIGIADRNVKLGTYTCLRCAIDARAHAFGLLIGAPANDNDGGASK
ncbi:HNH endonuclease signature motif containing protein [Labrenzia sp. CP4]|jgi:hypothetical protein|uniref:HNH endonuclease signature motif containing protein n=1 Tax=Labrenzia sp. CP4 TaxID=1674922 RepID=UPI0007855900|nr:HNH endonuclease signature motif containing protein [Labrenzia sp. CP4]